MAVALIALFVALSGTGYAVTKLPNNSVGTAQLKNNAVTSAKIKNGSLVGADFQGGRAPVGPVGPAGPAGAAGQQGATGAAGTGAAVSFGTAVGDSPTTTSSTALATLGSATVTIPAGITATVIATFSAESTCRNGFWCTVRLFLDGTEMNPEDGNNFAFDAPAAAGDPASNDYEAHSITRVRTGVAAGSHTITAQIQVFGGTETFRLDDWSLVAVGYKQS